MIDNGNGGWYRGGDGEFYCTFGEDCNLSIGGTGYAAIAYWSSSGSPIDSRMIFGPFTIPENTLTTLEFLESYYYAEYQVDPNIVEVSTDSGNSWSTIYTSNPNIIGSSWKNTVIDLSEFSESSIHLSFRYTCSLGNSEAWLIDHVGLYLSSIHLIFCKKIYSDYLNLKLAYICLHLTYAKYF